MRNISFNYVVVRGGADYGYLMPAENSTPTIMMDGEGEIKTSLRGQFCKTVFDYFGNPDPALDINWLSDLIRPEIVIDGVIHSLGVYIPTTVEEVFDASGINMLNYSVEAYDRCWLLKNTIPSQVFFEHGVKYLTAIQALLTASGVALIAATDSSATIQEDRSDWNIGTDCLTIVNQLLSEINYNPVWFDHDGAAILEPASEPLAINIEHTLDADDPDTLIIPGLRKTTDIYNAPNAFLCVCNNADKDGVMTALAENTNPQSPLSISRRGRRIMTVVNVDNIASQEELQAYANRIRNESMITGETITVQTGILPGFGVNDVTALSYGDTFAVCLESAWSMDLSVGGKMTHTLEKVVVNLG